MSYVKKIEKKSKVIAMSEKLESDLNKMTQYIIEFKNTLSEINKSDEEELNEIKTVLSNNHKYQKAALELFDFLRMTTHWHQSRSEL